jgi:hypothetical protein
MIEAKLAKEGKNMPDVLWLRGETAFGDPMSSYYLTLTSFVKENPAAGGSRQLTADELKETLSNYLHTCDIAALLANLGIPPTKTAAVILYSGVGAPAVAKPFGLKTRGGKLARTQFKDQKGEPKPNQTWVPDKFSQQPLRKRPAGSSTGKTSHHDLWSQKGSDSPGSTTTIKLGEINSFRCEFSLDKELAPFVLSNGDRCVHMCAPPSPVDSSILITHFGQASNIAYKHEVKDKSGGKGESMTIVSFADGHTHTKVLVDNGWQPSIEVKGAAIVEKSLDHLLVEVENGEVIMMMDPSSTAGSTKKKKKSVKSASKKSKVRHTRSAATPQRKVLQQPP